MITAPPYQYLDELFNYPLDSFEFYAGEKISFKAGQTHTRAVAESLLQQIGPEDHFIGFNLISFQKEIRICIVIQYDSTLDSSLYSELGNIITGKLANRIHTSERLIVSPPYSVQPRTLARMLKAADVLYEHPFIHQSIESGFLKNINCRLLVIPLLEEETGHA